jgi:hypothetical protein
MKLLGMRYLLYDTNDVKKLVQACVLAVSQQEGSKKITGSLLTCEYRGRYV